MDNPFTPLLQAIWQTKIARYLIVACVGATVDVLLFAFLIYGLDVHYLWAGVGAFVVSTLTNYLLSVRFVFSAEPVERLQTIPDRVANTKLAKAVASRA